MKSQSKSNKGAVTQSVIIKGKKNRVKQVVLPIPDAPGPQPREVRRAIRTPLTLGRLRLIGAIGFIADVWAVGQIVANFSDAMELQQPLDSNGPFYAVLFGGLLLILVWRFGAPVPKEATLRASRMRSKRLPVAYGDTTGRVALAWVGGRCSHCVKESARRPGTVVLYHRYMNSVPRAAEDGSMYNAPVRAYVLGCSRSPKHFEEIQDTDTSWLP